MSTRSKGSFYREMRKSYAAAAELLRNHGLDTEVSERWCRRDEETVVVSFELRTAQEPPCHLADEARIVAAF